MGGDNPRRTEEEWERIFRMKREIERMTEWHTLKVALSAEQSGRGANRAERRKQEAKARKARR